MIFLVCLLTNYLIVVGTNVMRRRGSSQIVFQHFPSLLNLVFPQKIRASLAFHCKCFLTSDIDVLKRKNLKLLRLKQTGSQFPLNEIQLCFHFPGKGNRWTFCWYQVYCTFPIPEDLVLPVACSSSQAIKYTVICFYKILLYKWLDQVLSIIPKQLVL